MSPAPSGPPTGPTRLARVGLVARALASRRPGRWLLWYLAAVLLGTVLLELPVASTGPRSAGLGTAAFSATAAICAAGLTAVDVGSYWSGFGQAVLLVLMELGGLGVMVLACLVGLQVSDRLGLRSRMLAGADREPHGERPAIGPGGVPAPATIRRVVTGVLRVSLVVQTAVWLLVSLRLVLGHDQPVGSALWQGLFLAVSAFTNTGLSLRPDGVASFAGDPVLLGALLGAVVAGGIGYPVLHELARTRRWRQWSVHSRLTVITTTVLLVVGPLVVLLTERHNPDTLAGLPAGSAVLAAVFAGVAPRTSAFTVFDYSRAAPATLLTTSGLMFVGGGSAGTAGGIKVGTLAVLVLAVGSELRGRTDVDVYGRRIAAATVRQALAVVLLALAVLAMAAVALLEIAPERGQTALFDVVSAFSTSGMSAGEPGGRVGHLPGAGQLLLLALVVTGRFGSLWLASRLALRERRQLFRNPQARPLVG